MVFKKKASSPRMCITVDIAKAFNSTSIPYILKIMDLMGFPKCGGVGQRNAWKQWFPGSYQW